MVYIITKFDKNFDTNFDMEFISLDSIVLIQINGVLGFWGFGVLGGCVWGLGGRVWGLGG